jgi:tRNA(fMet)-specific endonuclease VapC
MSESTYLLDTSMFSYIAKGNSPAARREWLRLSQDREAAVCISVITEAEVRYGLAKHLPSRERTNAIKGMLTQLQILPWGSAEAAAYAQTRTQLESKGVTLSVMDMLIASQAIAAGAILVTRDRIFESIPALHATVNWATDL